ncbi:MAG: GNAT family N-acetyltransferase [Candidatus Methanoperedens sp.]|nr:GNAT family N-acetyltransferase [Candidatus Methanoperedens sp.]
MSPDVLHIVPLTNRSEITHFNSTNADLNDFLKNDKMDSYPYHKFPCIRIARLAVDRRFERRGIGRFLLSVAIGKAISVSNEIGCRYITVDSKPESLGFYEKHNFKIVKKYRHSMYPKMYLDMNPIADMMRKKKSFL